MATLKETLKQTHNWSLSRINELCSRDDFEEVVNGDSIRQEFREWLDIEKETNVLSLEYIDDFGSGVDIIEI
jgi:ssRNA-specific RNase YbeY (16S rRNA maturation enzyme)|tara:strand:+ start:317 stop:532 length:216 start_codon:yes stop_codon:yes gene_type:complete